MRQRHVHKSVTILSLMLGAVLFTGCGQLASLPEKERYQYIDNVLGAIDYGTAGKVVSVIKDKGDGVFSPSVKYVEYHDGEAFQSLSERLRSHSSISCDNTLSERQIRCTYDHVRIDLKRTSATNPTVVLEITDVFNGREPNQKGLGQEVLQP